MSAERKSYPEPCDRVGQRSARRLTLVSRGYRSPCAGAPAADTAEMGLPAAIAPTPGPASTGSGVTRGETRIFPALTRRPCGDMREHATRELLHACLSGAALWCIMALAIAMACFV